MGEHLLVGYWDADEYDDHVVGLGVRSMGF